LPNAAILAAVTAATGGGGTSTPTPPQGRLTLQTAVPVMTTTQSAKTTIFYTPYVGNKVPIYDGTNMTMTTFAELSVATTDTTKSPAAIGASKVNDWFVWNDGGTIRIGHGPDWTSDTARSAGTALVMVNGVYLNNASITNGPAASRGTFVGTTRSNASSQLDWVYGGASVQGFFGIWNCYNRCCVQSIAFQNTSSWAYSSTTWRGANALNNTRTYFISGLAEDAFQGAYTQVVGSTAGNQAANGVGYDSWATKSLAASPDSKRDVIDVGSLVHIGAGGNPHRWYDPGDVATVAAAITAGLSQIDPRDADYFAARHAAFVTTALSGYHRLISTIASTYSGVAVGASESIFAPLAAALRLDLVTPPSFLKAISEGTDPSPADKTRIDAEISSRAIKVYVYNSQNSTPDVAAQVAACRSAGIPVVAVSETLSPAGATFQQWQVRQLGALELALHQATGR